MNSRDGNRTGPPHPPPASTRWSQGGFLQVRGAVCPPPETAEQLLEPSAGWGGGLQTVQACLTRACLQGESIHPNLPPGTETDDRAGGGKDPLSCRTGCVVT